ncbi:MAG: hypothetical protein B6242_09970 [Anaerolineaceae bacterium 4572_78]|nr:MAG: hypothetical protein B6242_09970 [Anaerolineaceae bacterium 4572_78]
MKNIRFFNMGMNYILLFVFLILLLMIYIRLSSSTQMLPPTPIVNISSPISTSTPFTTIQPTKVILDIPSPTLTVDFIKATSKIDDVISISTVKASFDPPAITHTAKPKKSTPQVENITSYSSPTPQVILAMPSQTQTIVIIEPTPQGDSQNLFPPDIASLKNLMLNLVNADRANAGLAVVAWDSTATLAGQNHAQDMAGNNFFSHQNMAGEGPDHRYSAVGGLNVISENISTMWVRFADGSPAPIYDWESLLRQEQQSLMSSQEHRNTILNPVHTHLGIGITYNPDTGQFCIVQEFVSHYIQLQLLPKQLPLGSTHQVQGSLLSSVHTPLIGISYEPFLKPMSETELESSGTYISSAKIFHAFNPLVNNDGTFIADITFNHEDKRGLYHVLIWVTIDGYSEQVIVSDVIVHVS